MTRTNSNARAVLQDDIKFKELVEIPHLLEIQKNSFDMFVKEGIKEELLNINPIVDNSGKLQLEFLENYKVEEPEHTFDECQELEITYGAPLRVPVRLLNKETGEVIEQEVFMSEIPLMSDRGTFLINGAERVIVSQFARSPGVYIRQKMINSKPSKLVMASIIPNRGSWLEFELEKDDTILAYINKIKKVPLAIFLGAIGIVEKDLVNIKHQDVLAKSFDKFKLLSQEQSMIELYKKLNPGDPVTIDGARNYLNNMFFNPSKYTLSKVGRYRINKRLGLKIKEDNTILTKEDVVGVVDELLKIYVEKGITDDIDHLANRRVRSAGEQMQKQLRVGLARLQRLIVEQMTLKKDEKIMPQSLINIRPLVAVMREFFGSSQMSQFMDQTNPLAEIAHERRLSSLGPGGLTKERAGFEVRDIHPSHYGRICPIETPEGPNAGLIGPLSTYAKVNKYGFIVSPYRKVVNGKLTDEVEFFTADAEEKKCVAAWDAPIKDEKFTNKQVVARVNRQFQLVDASEVEYIGISPKQLVGVSCGLIPFLEHDDANRALMGANMQRQAVPLLKTERALIGTGLEMAVGVDSGGVLCAEEEGVVDHVTGDEVVIKQKLGKKKKYTLKKYLRSNQNTCKSQRAVVRKNQKIDKGDIIADGAATNHGELALGKNIIACFLPWEGYNFEDAIVISQRLVKQDIFTSIHILKYEVEVRSTKIGAEEMTREVPNVSEDSLRNLDENGLVRIGAMVKSGDILVGKVTPKGESEPPAEEKLLRAIFGDRARDMKDTSLRVSSGEKGKVVGVRVFSRDKKDTLPPGVNQTVRIYIAQLRKVSVGDKMAGRHGNKGVISTILPEEDMPFLPNGQPVDIILNPLGVPSRMNVGQLFETLIGMAQYVLKQDIKVQLFDEIVGQNESVKLTEQQLLKAKSEKGYEWLESSGKTLLRDGRTGLPMARKVTVGCMYMLKLIHLVEDKIHARSTGPYSLVTQQPLGGKAQYGGQRFGEMEVWALEAYGAACTLQEILTIKSDDLIGRAKAYEAIIKGRSLVKPGTPESFRVLLRELRSIALDVKVISEGVEIDTR